MDGRGRSEEQAPLQPFSQEHADQVPEVTVLEGSMVAKEDEDDGCGPPQYYVAHESVSHEYILSALLKHRGIDGSDPEQVLDPIFHCLLAWMARGVLYEKPECWDPSPVLRSLPFAKPSIMLTTSSKGNKIARLTYWRSEDRQTPTTDSSDDEERGKRSGGQSAVKRWKIWEFCFFDVNAQVIRTGEYSDEQPGHMVTSGRASFASHPVAVKTTSDGLNHSSEPDYSFDYY